MFVYSMKASTLKLVAVIAVSIAALAVLLNMIPTYQPTSASLMYTDTVKYTYSGVKTNDDRLAFLSQFGWEVEPTPEEQNVTIPGEFDRVFVSYNELQKQQGLDLSKYKRKDVTRYTYRVTNFPDYDGAVLANVLVYRGRVIGGDICTADVSGFVQGFDGKVRLP